MLCSNDVQTVDVLLSLGAWKVLVSGPLLALTDDVVDDLSCDDFGLRCFLFFEPLAVMKGKRNSVI